MEASASHLQWEAHYRIVGMVIGSHFALMKKKNLTPRSACSENRTLVTEGESDFFHHCNISNLQTLLCGFFSFSFFSFSTMSLTFGYFFQLLKNMKEDVLNKNVLHVVGDKTI